MILTVFWGGVPFVLSSILKERKSNTIKSKKSYTCGFYSNLHGPKIILFTDTLSFIPHLVSSESLGKLVAHSDWDLYSNSPSRDLTTSQIPYKKSWWPLPTVPEVQRGIVIR